MGKIKLGARVLLTMDGGSIIEVKEDRKETNYARERIRKKYQRLRKGQHLE